MGNEAVLATLKGEICWTTNDNKVVIIFIIAYKQEIIQEILSQRVTTDNKMTITNDADWVKKKETK
jgi:hypothetical protein